MKRLLAYNIALLLVSVLFIANSPDCSAQQKLRSYVIGFYNLENLFDTYHDDGKNDFEYLPDGANQWTEVKYKKKVENMAKVIRAMKEDNKVYHAVLGVSEIENRHVLEDLVNDPQIEDAGFQIVHFDGPDFRGVDVALLYRPNAFKLLDELELAYRLSNIGDTKTLVLHPSSTISLHSTDKQKEDAGVFDDLIRISVGIEDIEDLKDDFDKAFRAIGIEA